MRTPPPEFVAARNALAKERRAAGERADAAEIAALRRPSWVDWALACVSDDESDAVAAFAAAAATVRAAQHAVVDGRSADVAGALRSLRDSAASLAKRADATLRGAGRGSELPAILERLTTVAGDAGATAALAAGELHPDLVPENVLEDVPETPTEAVPPTKPARRPPRQARASTPPPTPDPPEPSRREIEQATAALRLAERGVARAERRATEADHTRENAERAAAKADAALTVANEQAADARRRLDEAQAALADAAATFAALTRAPHDSVSDTAISDRRDETDQADPASAVSDTEVRPDRADFGSAVSDTESSRRITRAGKPRSGDAP